MGSTEEIHDRERALALRLAKVIVTHLRNKEGGMEVEPPTEVDWGLVRLRLKVHNAPITVTLQIDP